MKQILITMGAAALAFALALPAQTAGAQQPAKTPHAYGDKDHDGKCDVTGQAVGQGRMGMRGGRGRMRCWSRTGR